MVRRVKEESGGSRWIVLNPETAWYAEEPVLAT